MLTKSPIVVNLFGGPGCGKSTGAAQVFSDLKKAGVNAELVAEFAKDKTWEKNDVALSCQEYIFGKQSYRLARCRDDVDVIVTDSPLLLALLYNKNPALDSSFDRVVTRVFDTYHNMNFILNRVKPYNPKGRKQTEKESRELDDSTTKLLNHFKYSYSVVNGDERGYNKITEEVLKFLEDAGIRSNTGYVPSSYYDVVSPSAKKLIDGILEHLKDVLEGYYIIRK